MSRKKYDIIIEFFEKRYYIILKLNKTKIMQTFGNIYFESDAEFEDYCFAPYISIIKVDSSIHPHYTWASDYSESCKKDIAEGKSFIIMDEDSTIVRRKGVAEKRLPVYKDGEPLGQDAPASLKFSNLDTWLGTFPRKYKESFEKLFEENPNISYTEIAKEIGVSEEWAFQLLHMWKNRKR